MFLSRQHRTALGGGDRTAIAALQGHSNSIISVAFSLDGRRLVSASPDQTARLWDGITGQPIAALRGHTERLWNALFSPDGKRVVTTSVDQTLRLWDSTSGDLIAVLRGHKSEVRNAEFVARGSILVSFAIDGETRDMGHGAGGAERHPAGARELCL